MFVAVVALLGPPQAGAHLRSGVLAVDYLADVSPPEARVRAALVARVYESDLALGLTARSGHSVVVFGYLGEPLARLSSAGVVVNRASPTAASAGLLRLQPRGSTLIWHDSRLRGLRPGVSRRKWSVPLLVDGRRVPLTGELWRVHPPSEWLWLAFGLPFTLATALLLLVRRTDWTRRASVAFGLGGGAGMIATGLGFALDSYAGGGRWIELANELALALAGIAVIVRGSGNVRAFAGGALGLLALSVGLTKLPVLLHGAVLSVWPAASARIAVALSIWAGGAATALGLLTFEDVLQKGETRLR